MSSEPGGSRRGREGSSLERFDSSLARNLFGRGPQLGLIRFAEDLIHYVVALVLIGVAAVVLYRAVHDLFTTKLPFAEATTAAINSVLFAIIVLELMRTVVAHFEDGGLQLQPFLIIGIISAVRGILSVGARLSLGANVNILHSALELGVEAGVVLCLTLSLVLVRRFVGSRESDPAA